MTSWAATSAASSAGHAAEIGRAPPRTTRSQRTDPRVDCRGVAERADADRGIDTLLDQIDRPVEQGSRTLTSGNCVEEIRHQRQHVAPPEHDRRGQAQLATRGAALPDRGLLDFSQIRQHAAGAGEKPLPRLGDADGPGGAVEQPHAEPCFKLGDRAGDRGRRTIQTTRRLGEAAAVGHLGEDGDIVDPIHYCILRKISCF